jgi:hypothetical protein
MDTVDANRALGLPDDSREYFSVRNILADLGVKSIRLIVGASSSSSRVFFLFREGGSVTTCDTPAHFPPSHFVLPLPLVGDPYLTY